MGVWAEAAAEYIRRDQADCRPTVSVVDEECPACGGALYSVDGEGAACPACGEASALVEELCGVGG